MGYLELQEFFHGFEDILLPHVGIEVSACRLVGKKRHVGSRVLLTLEIIGRIVDPHDGPVIELDSSDFPGGIDGYRYVIKEAWLWDYLRCLGVISRDQNHGVLLLLCVVERDLECFFKLSDLTDRAAGISLVALLIDRR